MSPDFILRMAWRDSRTSRRRLLFFSLSITVGIAALVAIWSFRTSLSASIDEQARTLLGADLLVESNRTFTPPAETFLHSLGGGEAREVRFSTMAVFPGHGTRLVHLRALGGDFPFYGRMETDPAEALEHLRKGNCAIIDESLLYQFHATVGGIISLGGRNFKIAGVLKKVPGDASFAASVAPRVYINLEDLAPLDLLRPGSVAHYRAYLKFPETPDLKSRIAALTPSLQGLGLEFETVEKRKKDLGESLQNLYRFLNLVGFISLLLGAVGMASAIQAHLRQKVRTGAILRCLGGSTRGTAAIYLIQAAAMSLFGAFLGGLLGLALQQVLPKVLQAFLPLTIRQVIAWQPVLCGSFIGCGICLLFALPPLVRFRRLSPLLILRSAASGSETARDSLETMAYALMAGSVTAFALWQSETWMQGLIIAAALALAVAIFAGAARLLMALLRHRLPQSWSFVFRQGLANLYRPDNRTLLLVVSLGLGTFLLLSLHLTRGVLLDQFHSIDRNDQPNIFIFDIQPDQKGAVETLVRSLGYPILQEAPIVTMRLLEIRGRKTSDILADPHRKIPEWELEREYRSTYREETTGTEQITAGQWVGRITYHPGDVVPISLDREIAQDFSVKVGDELVFDVQGVSVRTRIASLRKVDWKRFQTNFFVVFPVGVLENAPTFHVLVSRVPTPADSARLQNSVVAQFANVSALDLTAVIETVDSILGKVALVIRVMSLFTLAAGLLVVASAIWSGRYQRVEETVLLRTLGASRRQIWQILGAEYFFLGLLAGLLGTGLAVAASWALAVFVFKLTYVASYGPMLVAFLSATLLTLLLGLLTSRGVGSAPPLQILRAETD